MSRNKYSATSGPDWRDCWDSLDEMYQDDIFPLDIRLVAGKNLIGERIFTWEVRQHGMDRVYGRQSFMDSYPTSSATAAGGLYAAIHRAWSAIEEEVKK